MSAQRTAAEDELDTFLLQEKTKQFGGDVKVDKDYLSVNTVIVNRRRISQSDW